MFAVIFSCVHESSVTPFLSVANEICNTCACAGVGFCTEDVNLCRLPGWDRQSYGYHGDDGHAFPGRGQGKEYGPTFTAGAGCIHHCLIIFEHIISSCLEVNSGEMWTLASMKVEGVMLCSEQVSFSTATFCIEVCPRCGNDALEMKFDICFIVCCTGDVIGAILNRAEKTISYTKNGIHLGVAFTGVAEERLFPTVGFRTKEEEVGICYETLLLLSAFGLDAEIGARAVTNFQAGSLEFPALLL